MQLSIARMHSLSLFILVSRFQIEKFFHFL